MSSIESIVQSEIQDFIHNPITVAEGYEFNQYENIKKTHLYLNSRFYGGYSNTTDAPLLDTVQTEDDRIFFNITLPRVRAVKRFFDVDLEEIVLDEIDPQSELALQLLNKDFKRWANKSDKNGQTLSQDLNDFRDPLLEYGSLVLKVTKNKKPQIIPLQRYFVDPSVKRSADSRFNTIKHTMTPSALREKVADGWDADAIEELIKAHGEKSNASNSYEDDHGVNKITSSVLIDVYERYGYLEKEYIYSELAETKEGEKEIFTLTITGFGPDSAKKGNKESKDVKCLYKTEWKGDLPIIDHHLFKTHGRWQGIGVVELLYPFQQRMNEVANQKRISMELSALHLFQTADTTVLNNILTDLENGDVIKTKVPGAITPVNTDERNQAAFDSEIITYTTGADKVSFANDLLSGGDVPSTTPATNTVVQNNNQVLVHLQDRENFTNFIADNYIKRWVVPQLIKDMDDEHFLRVVSQPGDLLQIDERLTDINFFEEVKNRALKTGSVVDIIEGEDLRNELMKKLRAKGPNRYVKVLQGYYKNKIGDIFVVIGNEKKDFAKVAGNTLSFFQMLQNPQVLDDPVMRIFATNYAREIGMDTSKMELAYAQRDNALAQQQPVKSNVRPPVAQQDPNLATVQ